VVALVVAAFLLFVGGWLVFKPSRNNAISTATTPVTGQTSLATPAATATDPVKLDSVETADFKYVKPSGWAEISTKTLESTGAASGIGRPTDPVATFSIKVSNAIPKDSNDLKNSTLNELKKFTNFQLLSDADTKVDGQADQKFTYTFTSGSNKITQQMNVIPYKQKTFFLLFHSTTADFDKQTSDFAGILSNFHFK